MQSFKHCHYHLIPFFCLVLLAKCNEEGPEQEDWDRKMAKIKADSEESVIKLATILSKNPYTQSLRPDLNEQEIFEYIKNKLMNMFGNSTAEMIFMEEILKEGKKDLSPEVRAKITETYNEHSKLTKRRVFIEQISKGFENKEYVRKLLTRTSEIYGRMVAKEVLNIDEPCNLKYQNQKDVYLTTFSNFWFSMIENDKSSMYIYEKDKTWDTQQKNTEILLKMMEGMLNDPDLKFCRWRKLLYCSPITSTCNCMSIGDTRKLGIKFEIILKRQENSCVIPKAQVCPPPDFVRGRKTPFPTDGTFASIEDIEVALECEKLTSCIVDGSDLECLMDNIVTVKKLKDLPSIVDIFDNRLCTCKSFKKTEKSNSKDEL